MTRSSSRQEASGATSNTAHAVMPSTLSAVQWERGPIAEKGKKLMQSLRSRSRRRESEPRGSRLVRETASCTVSFLSCVSDARGSSDMSSSMQVRSSSSSWVRGVTASIVSNGKQARDSFLRWVSQLKSASCLTVHPPDLALVSMTGSMSAPFLPSLLACGDGKAVTQQAGGEKQPG